MKKIRFISLKFFLLPGLILSLNILLMAQTGGRKPGANKSTAATKTSVKKFCQALSDNKWPMVKEMIMQGVDLKVTNCEHTPLHYAIETSKSSLEIVELLLQKGVDVNAAGNNGDPPLYDAVRSLDAPPDIEIVRILLKAGANANARSAETADCEATPLIAAVIEDDISIVKLLLENGADPNLTDSRGYNAYMITATTDKNSDKLALLKPVTKNLISPAEEKRAAAERTGNFLKNNVAEIYYETHGAKTGTPLFVLHGGPAFDHQYFLANSAFDNLGKNRPVIFYDQRGGGNSSDLRKGEYTPTVADQVEDLENLRKHLGYEKIDLAGHSWGGFLAMAYTAKYPQHLAHLILIDSSSPESNSFRSELEAYYPDEYEEMSQMFYSSVSDAGWWGVNDDSLRRALVAYMKMLFHSPQKRDAFIAGSQQYTYNRHLNAQLNDSANEIDLTNDLKKLKVPTLILYGAWDRNISLSIAESIQKTIPESQLVIFKESGHLPFYEEPEKFVSVVEDFLQRHEVRDN